MREREREYIILFKCLMRRYNIAHVLKSYHKDKIDICYYVGFVCLIIARNELYHIVV